MSTSSCQALPKRLNWELNTFHGVQISCISLNILVSFATLTASQMHHCRLTVSTAIHPLGHIAVILNVSRIFAHIPPSMYGRMISGKRVEFGVGAYVKWWQVTSPHKDGVKAGMAIEADDWPTSKPEFQDQCQNHQSVSSHFSRMPC